MWDYTEQVKAHFLNPRHVGEMRDPDLEATVGDMACGDALRLMLRLDETGRIADARFQTFGCAGAIASSDAFIDLILGKTLEEAERVTSADVVASLGGLPEPKVHCSVLGVKALHEAARRGGGGLPAGRSAGPAVCKCFRVPEAAIAETVRSRRLRTVDEVTETTRAGSGCGGCRGDIQAIVHRLNGPASQEAGPSGESNV